MIGALDTVLQGVLLGGLYALFAAGLSLIFGVMKLVNLAHGDMIVLAAFLIFALDAFSGPAALARGARDAAGHVCARLRAAISAAQPRRRPRRAAAAADNLRPVDRHPERPARRLLRRQPPHLRRRLEGASIPLGDGLAVGLLAADDVGDGRRRHRRAQSTLLPHPHGPRLSRRLRRSRHRATDGRRQPQSVRCRDGAGARRLRRSRRCFSACAPISILRSAPRG